MIKILILEDEIPARNKLKRFLSELDVQIKVVGEIDAVTMGVSFLKNNDVDLIFSDIELLDGNSFDIFSQVALQCPVIFTTAYDQFWMKAFESNGVDYLLKPFSKERFRRSWDKFVMLQKAASEDFNPVANLIKQIQNKFSEKEFKKRFVISTSQKMYFIETENILLFEAKEGVITAYDNKHKKHLLTEATLKEVEEQVDPVNFFRINRSEIIQKSFIEKIERYDKNSFAIKLLGRDTYLKTSQSHTALFREWIEK